MELNGIIGTKMTAVDALKVFGKVASKVEVQEVDSLESPEARELVRKALSGGAPVCLLNGEPVRIVYKDGAFVVTKLSEEEFKSAILQND